MLAKKHRFPLAYKRYPFLPTIPPTLVTYGLVIFLISLADALMSYTTPVFLESRLRNTLEMGTILGISSIGGVFFDLFLEKNLSRKNYHFFLGLTFLAAAIFPTSFLILPPLVVFFILSMLIWGFYYELIQFANFRFIHATTIPAEHCASWGTLSIFKSAAYLAGPLLASFLINSSFNAVFVSALGLVGFACFFYLAFLKKNKEVKGTAQAPSRMSFLCQLQIMKSLMKKVWPLWLFSFSILLVDACFWSIGTILSEDLKKTHPLGGFLLVVYLLPSLFIGLFTKKASGRIGKKRAAFLSGILSGFFLMIAGFITQPVLLLGMILTSSIFSALAVPEILAVYEDYVARLGKASDEIVALERSAENFAYILGPVLGGIIATLTGLQKTFSVTGFFLTAISLLALVIVPRKIHLPQKEIASELSHSL